ncbi:MAG: type 1 glutamine amidotransferase [Nitrospirae bacterium]|nr:MAG: type 1 glutamine amidotransferase [Nitrospirota bacterium]
MPRLLVLQHIACEHLGLIEPVLKERGQEFWYVRPFAGEDIPKDLAGWDGVIALGGPMSANDGDRIGFIADELRLLTKVLEAGMPALGICLGAQLIAKAAGAQVTAGEEKEIGWYPLRLTEEGKKDRVLTGLPESFPVFQWHGETFDVPRGAVGLAGSERYSSQAFRLGEKVYGFQFHLETTQPMIIEWLDLYREEHAQCGGTVQGRASVMAKTALLKSAAEQRARQVFGRYFASIG